MKIEDNTLENADGFFQWPHPKIAWGHLHFNDDEECKKADVASTIRIHRYAHIDLSGDLHIGPWTMIDPYVQIMTHEHCIDNTEKPLLQQHLEDTKGKLITVRPLTLEGDNWIFNNSIILPQCEYIARGVVIGAGSVVTKSIHTKYGVWAGNPARMIRKRGIREGGVA